MRRIRFSQLALVALAFLLLGTLTACNTVAGAGEDISATGQAVSKTATDVKSQF
ncbi:MAG: entericidin A/B family lipoprotein [Geminicoccaceae bacterium]